MTIDEYPQLVEKITAIIKGDDREELEKLVHGKIIFNPSAFTLGILFVKNELNQTLIHLCAIHGALKCLSYVIYFNILSPAELDNSNKAALVYAIETLKEEDTRNKSIIAILLRITDTSNVISEGVDLRDIMTDWQRYLFDNYKEIYISTD